VFGKIQDANNADGKDVTITALEQVKLSKRNIIVGLPGGGKSTLFEWLQLAIANVEEELIAGDGQAIPLLLRVRQLDPKNLPRGADLIERATASRDRATLMPSGWIERQMEAGRVFFMLDGLDETEPAIRDKYILPWVTELCRQYPQCHYLLSSRPVGYRSGSLRRLNFAECELEDFREPEIAAYTRHWCTAIRLARNDPDDEARREGAKEGDEIVASQIASLY
jgi:predicted NACHT family NTPase